ADPDEGRGRRSPPGSGNRRGVIARGRRATLPWAPPLPERDLMPRGRRDGRNYSRSIGECACSKAADDPVEETGRRVGSATPLRIERPGAARAIPAGGRSTPARPRGDRLRGGVWIHGR